MVCWIIRIARQSVPVPIVGVARIGKVKNGGGVIRPPAGGGRVIRTFINRVAAAIKVYCFGMVLIGDTVRAVDIHIVKIIVLARRPSVSLVDNGTIPRLLRKKKKITHSGQ